MTCMVVRLSGGGISARRHFQTSEEAISETFKEDIMKQERKTATKAKRTTKAAAAEAPWHVRARGLPLALFHTTVGPIIGRVEKVDDPDVGSFNLRLWAPAALRMAFEPGQPGVTSLNAKHMVTFQPIALVETYLDLSSATPFGRSPVPAALIPSYDQYFERTVLGEYSFTRVVEHVEQAAPHEAPIGLQEFPWPAGSNPHTWLTCRVFGIPGDVTIERDDPRRVLVKRSFFGWAYGAMPEKVASSFNLSLDDVRAVFDEIDKVIVSDESKKRVKTFLNSETNKGISDSNVIDPDVAPDGTDDENSLS